jgi:integrase
VHLNPVLLAKPVQLLTVSELKKWRDSLLGKVAPATINRVGRCLCAALELARQHDERIQNRQAWELGLAGLPDAQEVRNVIIPDEKVREFVSTAYGRDPQLGLLIDVLAITGARPSQVVRLRVEDFHDHLVAAEADDAEIRQGWRQKPQPEKAGTLFRADHRAAGGEAERGGQEPCRRCAVAH